jgi:hypothetical protein
MPVNRSFGFKTLAGREAKRRFPNPNVECRTKFEQPRREDAKSNHSSTLLDTNLEWKLEDPKH